MLKGWLVKGCVLKDWLVKGCVLKGCVKDHSLFWLLLTICNSPLSVNINIESLDTLLNVSLFSFIVHNTVSVFVFTIDNIFSPPIINLMSSSILLFW